MAPSDVEDSDDYYTSSDEYEDVEIPLAPKRRHPASNPKEVHRRMALQCQYCWKSGEPGVTLLKCGGCRRAVYCSKLCQKNAWKQHKPKCLDAQETRAGLDTSLLLQRKLLHKFVEKHRPTILNASYRALDIEAHPERALQDVLYVRVRRRPGHPRTETAFYVIDAEVTPIDSFVRAKDQIRECLREGPGGMPVTEDQKKGIFHGYMVVFTTDHDEISEFIPVAFSTAGERDVYSIGGIKGMSWKDQLVTMLNEGIVY
ncbi:hypothetical protein EIP91_006558 [Steccherinum ochraceum]|uniref:MYND-type domain-containing protein n=1 Tax=Steccherinum ochraceum TaxID=92696 RepID=A0A4V2MVM9_9APHY|nr:hypothetical protein EIP91_006558 [Steccherinum ochraceum]